MWPEIILTAENGTLKCLASAIIIAALAWPFIGGSLTQISKLVSLNFFMLSFFELGLAFINIFIHNYIIRIRTSVLEVFCADNEQIKLLDVSGIFLFKKMFN